MDCQRTWMSDHVRNWIAFFAMVVLSAKSTFSLVAVLAVEFGGLLWKSAALLTHLFAGMMLWNGVLLSSMVRAYRLVYAFFVLGRWFIISKSIAMISSMAIHLD
jgi:hypothetical protein